MKNRLVFIALLCLSISGCATSDYDAANEQQRPSGMSGGGMGRGGGGGGHQQGPPNMQNNDTNNERVLPEEAFTACAGKKAGDYVVLVLADGKEIQATCQLMEDQMVAVPQQKMKPNRR